MENDGLVKVIPDDHERGLFLLELILSSIDLQIIAIKYHIRRKTSYAVVENLINNINLLFSYKEHIPVGYYPRVIIYLNLCGEFLTKT